MRDLKALAVLSLLLFPSVAGLAAGPQWTWEAGKQTNNGAITVKSVTGAGSYSTTQNPTGAIAKLNQNAVIQPPTIVVQATSGVPVKVLNDPCDSTNDTLAVTADRLTILSCQSSVWKASAWTPSSFSSYRYVPAAVVCTESCDNFGTCGYPGSYASSNPLSFSCFSYSTGNSSCATTEMLSFCTSGSVSGRTCFGGHSTCVK